LLQLKLAPATTVAVNPCQHHLKLAHPIEAELCLPSGYMCSWRSEITAPIKASIPNWFEVLLTFATFVTGTKCILHHSITTTHVESGLSKGFSHPFYIYTLFIVTAA
jgi:hypothetical protein